MKEVEPISGLNPELIGRPVDAIVVEKLQNLEQQNLIVITLLGRIYDIQMAMLSKVDNNMADAIYDTHDAGGNFNPKMYVANFVDEKDNTGPVE